MNGDLIAQMSRALDQIQPQRPVGRIDEIAAGTCRIAGLAGQVALGDRIAMIGQGGGGEIVRLTREHAYMMADGATTGLKAGDPVALMRQTEFAPHESWIGRVIDPDGEPLDGRPILPGFAGQPVQNRPPAARRRKPLGARLETGLAVFNTLLPLVHGQRIGLFAGSGVGKSTLLADLARGVAADVIVIALVGERGREVRHFVEDVLGAEGMKRAVVVAATSDQAPHVRRRCAWAAMAVAEHFRDAGRSVMLFVDSVTRFCEAHREVAVAGGETAALRGFPASTGPAVASLCERAGPGVDGTGDITAVFSVLVAGSDMEEPVADMLRGVLDGHIVLDRAIAERGRFPAIDLLRSVSRSLPVAANAAENAAISQCRKLLGDYEKAEMMIQAGLYEKGTDPAIDAAIACEPALDRFMSVKDQRGTNAHFAVLRQALAAAETSRASG
ncbi:FliI/YscN family ATPase [Yoonia sp. 208BN28-4]|uniref:FliI/YscN family ATPase n=1 Tax=Yoonia sp. 208BN28-4 TaxID=3126505 RepID=UPI00309F7B46